jgi:phage tail sheath protein FI
MPTLSAPGVYYQTVDASDTVVAGVRTDVAGFVGIAERGPLDTPVPVESWRQFQAHFGGVTGGGYLAYTVRAFFENGGRRCWIVRVASRDPLAGAAAAAVVLRRWRPAAPHGPDVWRLAAAGPGVWGNALTVRVVETHRAQTTGDLGAASPPHLVEGRFPWLAVASTSGFTRGTLVRLTQAPTAWTYRVVSEVDPVRGRLVWVSERPELRLPYEEPLTDVDQTRPLIVESVEYTIAVLDAGVPVAQYAGLSLIPEHPAYGPRVLAPPAPPRDLEAERRLPAAPAPICLEELRPRYRRGPDDPRPGPVVADDVPSPATFALIDDASATPASRVGLAGGRDGLALLSTLDFTGEDAAPDDSNAVKAAKQRGIRALATVSEVAVVAVPDIHIQPILPPPRAPLPPCVPDPCLPHTTTPPAPPKLSAPPELPPVFDEAAIYRVQADLVQHCEERRDRIALLDAPVAAVRSPRPGIAGVRTWRTRFDSKFAALYHPWVRVVDPLRGVRALVRDIPPSGHVAGQIARTDVEIGVHKAPANAPLAWVQDVTALLTPEEHGVLNELGVNVIRALPGRGLRIMGARTVSSDPSWRYLPVRRLVLMVMKAIELATQWAVFEPHDVSTRTKLRLSLTTYLATLWQQGMLAGAAAEEAFFVKSDDENNTDDDRANGRLIVDVGVAPVFPYEFVVLRVWRAQNELEFAETTASLRGA